jgi:hypothetical protein
VADPVARVLQGRAYCKLHLPAFVKEHPYFVLQLGVADVGRALGTMKKILKFKQREVRFYSCQDL